MTASPGSLLPWQQGQWQTLMARVGARQLAHALLLTGPRGVGKQQFAGALTAALLCATPDREGCACGQCKPCVLLQTGAHPDHYPLSPQDDSKVIKIDQVRELCAALGMKSQFGGFKVASIMLAERMNRNAANSLLKTLEEPGANTLLILTTDQPGRLPATIRSRCQLLALPLPDRDQALSWLRAQAVQQPAELLLSLADGAPLLALQLDNAESMGRRAAQFDELLGLVQGKHDPVALAESWHKRDTQELLFWCNSWLMDMIRLKNAANARQTNTDLAQGLQLIGERLDLATLFAHLDRVQSAQARLHTAANVQLLLEDLLIPWAERSLIRA